jgi:hypothetical protein
VDLVLHPIHCVKAVPHCSELETISQDFVAVVV